MNDADKKLLGHVCFWGAPVAGLLLWPILFISIGGLRGTIFDINNSLIHAHFYLGAVAIIFFVVLFLMTAGGLILQKIEKRFWLFLAVAICVLLGNFCAAFMNFWMVLCMGYGEGCI